MTVETVVRSERYRSPVRSLAECNHRRDNREQPRYSVRRVALLLAPLPFASDNDRRAAGIVKIASRNRPSLTTARSIALSKLPTY